DKYGIANSFEVYQGTHTSGMAVRFQTFVMPFFSKHLCFSNDCK
ncbi:MAG: esterase, partial [Acidobacteriota bacterium]